MVGLATELIKRKSGPFKPQDFTDRYGAALAELLKEKSKGKKIVTTAAATEPARDNVVNLMDALRKSLKGQEKAGVASPTPKRKVRVK